MKKPIYRSQISFEYTNRTKTGKAKNYSITMDVITLATNKAEVLNDPLVMGKFFSAIKKKPDKIAIGEVKILNSTQHGETSDRF